MMTMRSLLLASALLAATSAAASAQTRDDVVAAPVLRAKVAVAGDLVRIGDVIDNAGTSGKIAIYRAPELGTTGTLSTAQVLSVLRTHQVIGVDTRDLREIQVTRLARTLLASERSGCRRAASFARARRCATPISQNPIWWRATRASR